MRDSDFGLNTYLTNVFKWMFIGLFLTGITSFYVSNSEELLNIIFGNSYMIWILLVVEIILVIYIGRSVQKYSYGVVLTSFIIYSIVNGLVFSTIFLVYELGSIALIFGITAGIFALMALYGYFTKRDLTKFGPILGFGLIAVIISIIINMFLQNEIFYLITTWVGIFVFVGLIIYDMNKLKQIYYNSSHDDELGKKTSIYGALQLYLDFINLFIRLLSLFGKSRD